jgi:hypothetical protein
LNLYFCLGTGADSVLAVPLLQQLFASALLHVFEQPEAFASPVLALADDVAALFAQQAFAGTSLLLTFSVLALSAVVTFCAETVFAVKAKMSATKDITSAIFFIDIIFKLNCITQKYYDLLDKQSFFLLKRC